MCGSSADVPNRYPNAKLDYYSNFNLNPNEHTNCNQYPNSRANS